MVNKEASQGLALEGIPNLQYWHESIELRDWMGSNKWFYLGETQIGSESRSWFYVSPNGLTWKLIEDWEGKIISLSQLSV